MAYIWSWAFGPESAADLENISGLWDSTNQSALNNAPSNTIIHTYTGDTSDRYSMGVRGNTLLKTTRQPLSGSGWFGAYFYYVGASDYSSRYFLEIRGPNSGYSIEILSATGRNLQLRFAGGGTIFTSSSPLNLADETWHHIGVKYDMRAEDNWGAEIFINGVSRISGSRNNGVLDPETSADIWLGGVNDSAIEFIHWSDLIAYDNLSDSNPYGQYVTRVSMNRDSSDSGSWSPASNTSTNAQAANLSGAISTSPVVSEATPLPGEEIILSSSIDIAGLTGVSGSIYGVTSHLFASGSSSVKLRSGLAESTFLAAVVYGDAQIDGENMYAYASSPTEPIGSNWSSGSTLVIHAEVQAP